MADLVIVAAAWLVACLLWLCLPDPFRCERRWCFRHQVGYSAYCRKHTDEILGAKEAGDGE